MEKPTILVVDDSMSNLLLVQDILNCDDSYNVLVESDGENVVTDLNNNKVDLILLDVMMPKIDGFEVCRRVKEDLAFKDIPVIFLTAKVDEASLIKGFDVGGVDYIKKPFLISELEARVRTHLQLKKTNESLKNELYQHYLTQQSLQQSQNDLQVRNKLAQIFLSDTDDNAYSHLLEVVLQYISLDYGVIGYFNEENRIACPSIFSGTIDSDRSYIYSLDDIGDIALAVLKKQTVVQTSNVSSLFYTTATVGFMVAVPIMYKTNVIGIISCAGKGSYQESYKDKLEGIAAFVSPIMFSRIATARYNAARMRAEQALKVSEQKYRTLFNQNNDAILVYKYDEASDSFNFVEANDTASELLGYSRDEIINAGAGKFLEPLFYDKFIANMKLALCGNSQTFDTYVVTSSGRTVSVELHVARYTDADGKTAVLNVMRDITLRKDFNRQMFNTIVDTQENERNRFAKDIHDGIGSYLTSLITYLNLLASSRISLSEMPDMFEEMKELVMEAVKESKNIAHDLMPDTLNNFGLVASVRSHAKHIFVDSGINLILESANFEEPSSKIVKTDLFRIICELFNNALKYSKATKVILILDTEGSYTRLKYSDDGVGFDYDEVMDRISDKQVSGLKNMQSRVANSNGQIDIRTSPGHGLEVQIVVLN